MSTHGSIPHTGKKVLFHTAFLQINVPLFVDQVEMHDGMQEHGTGMTTSTSGFADYFTFLVHDR